MFGGGIADGIEPVPTIQQALEREDIGSGTLQEIPVPEGSRADAAYVLVRDGFPVRYYGLRHITDPRGPIGWGVETFNFCGDVGLSG